MQLREPQRLGLGSIKDDYEEGLRRLLVVMATGVGKTPFFASIRSFFGFKKRVLVLVHRDELAQQAKEKIQVWNPDDTIGIEMGKSFASSTDTFVVASVPTLQGENNPRLLKFDPTEFDLVICDEAHHSIAPTWKAVLAYFGFDGEEDSKYGTLLVGVTATPGRGDKQAMGQVYSKISYQYLTLDAIRDGLLVDLKGYRVHSEDSLEGVGISRGDFVNSEVATIVDNVRRNALIVDAYKKWGEDGKFIAFNSDIAHAKHLAEEFNKAGIPCAAVWGTDKERKAKLDAHARGELVGVCNCDVLTEGYDDPTVSVMINGAPTRSQLKFIQRAGRAARLQRGINSLHEARAAGLTPLKEYGIIIDVVDGTDEHSLATLPTIFGLPPKLNFAGMPVLQAVGEYEDMAEKFPHVDFSELEDLAGVQTYVQQVDLFSLKLPRGIQDASPLQWYRTHDGAYILRLPEMKEQIEVYKGIKDGKWVVEGTIRKSYFSKGGWDTAEKAVQFADSMINVLGRGMLDSLRRNSKKAREKASPAAMCFLRNLTPKGMEHKIPEDLTKAEASALISKLIHHGVMNTTAPKK